MSRSGSQQSVTKTKKTTDPAKRLLNPKKPAAPKKPTTKAKATDDKEKRGPLSEEFVLDSDSSGDEAPSSNPTPAPPTKQRVVEKPAKKPVETVAGKMADKRKEPPAPAPVSKPKPVVRPPRAPGKAAVTSTAKRSRDDDDSSSSSGTPLAKRLKPKEAPKARPNVVAPKQRMSDASQVSRSTATATQSSTLSAKSKGTSPAKSSPLASSPPTNASDLEDHSHTQPQSQSQMQTQTQPKKKLQQPLPPPKSQRNGEVANGHTNGNSLSSTKKRKEREPEPQVSSKRPRVSKDVLKRASLFTKCYERYEALHREIVELKEPPEDKLADLLEMRERLVTMKSEISREVAASA